MKTKVFKILILIAVLFAFCMFFSNHVLASEASVSATNCNVGESFTVRCAAIWP